MKLLLLTLFLASCTLDPADRKILRLEGSRWQDGNVSVAFGDDIENPVLEVDGKKYRFTKYSRMSDGIHRYEASIPDGQNKYYTVVFLFEFRNSDSAWYKIHIGTDTREGYLRRL